MEESRERLLSRGPPKVPEATLEEVVPALTVAKQPPPTQALFPPPEATKEPSKASDQGSGVEVAKGKEVG